MSNVSWLALAALLLAVAANVGVFLFHMGASESMALIGAAIAFAILSTRE